MSSKRRFGQCLLLCILAVVMLGAGGTDSSVRFGRIGHNLMCVCGCGQVLIECNHVGCPDSSRMLKELQEQLGGVNGQGADSLILNWFVAKYGGTVLAAPIRGGFDIVAWIIPLGGFVVAIFGTAYLVRMWASRRRVAGDAGMYVDVPMNDAVRDRIRRETEY